MTSVHIHDDPEITMHMAEMQQELADEMCQFFYGKDVAW